MCTLYLRQKLTSLQCVSSKLDAVDFRSSLQTTAVTEDVKTTLSIVSVCAQASSTLCAALTSSSTINSCTNHTQKKKKKKKLFSALYMTLFTSPNHAKGTKLLES